MESFDVELEGLYFESPQNVRWRKLHLGKK
jgi:hypothetical protein